MQRPLRNLAVPAVAAVLAAPLSATAQCGDDPPANAAAYQLPLGSFTPSGISWTELDLFIYNPSGHEVKYIVLYDVATPDAGTPIDINQGCGIISGTVFRFDQFCTNTVVNGGVIGPRGFAALDLPALAGSIVRVIYIKGSGDDPFGTVRAELQGFSNGTGDFAHASLQLQRQACN